MASTPVPYVATLPMAQVSAPTIDLSRILFIHFTLYVPTAWHMALSEASLLSNFPNLVHDFTYGSPIGNPPLLLNIFIPPNLASTNLHPEIINAEIVAECVAGHMSGPFSIKEATTIFSGFFRTSPVGLVEKVPGNGFWWKIRHLSECDEDGLSTNRWINSDEFPTTYFIASWVAQFVSLYSNFFPSSSCSLF